MREEQQLEKMRRDWDARARENARHYVANGQEQWDEEDFYASGRRTLDEQILNDMTNICQGRDPKQMRVLEIGCGAGRITRALGELFGEVHAVDVSGEMAMLARQAVAHQPHVHIHHNNGKDLTVVPSQQPFDFAFSMIVFQHIPSYSVIENYVCEVNRLLRPGALFKFQVQGDASITAQPDDTWLGVAFTDQRAVAMANQCGFEARHRHGEGDQYFWLWYFKRG